MRGPDADLPPSCLGQSIWKLAEARLWLAQSKGKLCESSVLSDKTAPVTDDPSDVSLCWNRSLHLSFWIFWICNPSSRCLFCLRPLFFPLSLESLRVWFKSVIPEHDGNFPLWEPQKTNTVEPRCKSAGSHHCERFMQYNVLMYF